MTVAKITQAKADEIKGLECGNTHFNPVQDLNGNWIISLPTAQYLEPNDLELIEWEAPEINEPI